MKPTNYYDLVDEIYVRKDNREEFGYNYGNETENYLLRTFQQAVDLGTGSEELAAYVRDWPTLYHLSPQRADLLRPFRPHLEGKTVLEIGSGCGAITRFLGESSALVVAVEGSARRARITAERCRDLDSVTVVNDNFDAFDWDEKFDVVTLIGVLEYSNLFIKGEDPSTSLLKKAATFLKEDGVLLIAIENKLGSKYWAGAPEDHTGKAYDGIENRYNSETAITYGKQELADLLKGSGYPNCEFYFPFPDYKMPTIILRENHLDAPAFNVANLVMPNADYYQGRPYYSSFSLPLVLKQLIPNKLVGDLSNSFLVVASKPPISVIPSEVIGYAYSSLRKRPFTKENQFVIGDDQQIIVRRRKTHSDAVAAKNPWLIQHMEDEAYFQGDIHFTALMELVSAPNWSVKDLSDWMRPYYDLLKGLSRPVEDVDYLDGRYVDAVPFNVLVHNGGLRLFDLEWEISEPLPLHYVCCRGLFFCLGRIQEFQRPSADTPERLYALVERVLANFFPDREGLVADFVEKERRYFKCINPTDQCNPEDTALPIRERGVRGIMAQKDGLIAELTKENSRMLASVDWYKRTYETRSIAGLLLTRLKHSFYGKQSWGK